MITKERFSRLLKHRNALFQQLGENVAISSSRAMVKARSAAPFGPGQCRRRVLVVAMAWIAGAGG